MDKSLTGGKNEIIKLFTENQEQAMARAKYQAYRNSFVLGMINEFDKLRDRSLTPQGKEAVEKAREKFQNESQIDVELFPPGKIPIYKALERDVEYLQEIFKKSLKEHMNEFSEEAEKLAQESEYKIILRED